MIDPRLTESIAQLLRLRPSSKTQMQRFAMMRHNDVLCPRTNEVLNIVLSCFSKFGNVSYDIQGFFDRGTDILLRLVENPDATEPRAMFVAFQIKSHHDLEGKEWVKTLKAQWHDARNEYKDSLGHYYILICADPELHRDAIRLIGKEFAAETKVTVIPPEYSYTFLALSDERIYAVVDCMCRQGDPVLRQAMKEVIEFTPTETAICIQIAYNMTAVPHVAPAADDFLQSSFLKAVYQRFPDRERDFYVPANEEYEYDDDSEVDNEGGQIATTDQSDSHSVGAGDRFLDRIVDDLDSVDVCLSGGTWEAGDADSLRAIRAILLDGSVRHGLSGDALLEHVFALLRAPSGFAHEELDQ